MTLLKLVAFDDEDLGVLSAHMQDAILRVKDMAWQPASRRFIAVMNRFDWLHAYELSRSKTDGLNKKKAYERRRCALRFDHVQNIQLKNINFETSEQTLELLAIRFVPADLPGGAIELIFADDCAIRLNVECIEAELTDLGPGWKVRSMPEHEG